MEPDERSLRIPPRLALPEKRAPVFGIVVTDDEGKQRIVAASEIPNTQFRQYGWVMWAGESDQPFQWTERITAPNAGVWDEYEGRDTSVDADGRSEIQEISISPDGRTVTTRGYSIPVQGFIDNMWMIGPDNPAGRYEVSVSVADETTARFSFILGEPRGACPYSQMNLNWWWKNPSLRGDPGALDLSERVLKVFAVRFLSTASYRLASVSLASARVNQSIHIGKSTPSPFGGHPT